MSVAQPPQLRHARPRLPVVCVVDENITFDVLRGTACTQQLQQQLAPFILVNIGYPGDSPAAGWLLRARDLTFPGYPRLSTTPPAVEGVLLPEPGAPNYFGAEAFQQFLAEELFPLIESAYDTHPEQRVYFGHSIGGGFGLFTLFSKPELFTRYLISSPGLAYDGTTDLGVRYERYEFVAKLAREFIARRPTLTDVRLFLSVGTEEEFESALAPWQLTSNVYRLAHLLQDAAMPGLSLTMRAFAGESHTSVWPGAFLHGLKALLHG